jgi:biotin transport system substrate-specific component
MHILTLSRWKESAWAKVLAALVFAVATAVSARISVPLPFSPVPLTLQVLVVVSSGYILGAWGGLLAQGLYLQAILLGAPLAATGLGGPAAFLSPTGGYLIAFPAAAFVAGWVSRRGRRFQALWRMAGGLAALVVIYAGGVAWLSGFVGGLGRAWTLGVAPFVGVDILKVVIASALLSLRNR